jgi:hypothetical protein
VIFKYRDSNCHSEREKLWGIQVKKNGIEKGLIKKYMGKINVYFKKLFIGEKNIYNLTC